MKHIVWTDPPLELPDPGTKYPYRYYFLDFGFSRQFNNRDEVDEPMDKHWAAPEYKLGDPCNPFRTDVYSVGSLVHEKFVKVRG
jgi:hypothetical protein